MFFSAKGSFLHCSRARGHFAGVEQERINTVILNYSSKYVKLFLFLRGAIAPGIPLVTLRAIARAESGFHPYALSLNYPKRTAQEQGLKRGGMFLARQPRSLDEARAWTNWLSHRGLSVSIGLRQINSEHAVGLGLSPDQLFEPCTNITAGARLLVAYYKQAVAVLGDGQQALRYALSDYNSGSPTIGFRNGYLDTVINGEFGRTSPSGVNDDAKIVK
jgi:type IV secretion system protein VirB1